MLTLSNHIISTIPQCFYCRHYVDDGDGPLRCAAFPDRVPLDVYSGRHDHSETYPGDGGIRFDPKDQPPRERPVLGSE